MKGQLPKSRIFFDNLIQYLSAIPNTQQGNAIRNSIMALGPQQCRTQIEAHERQNQELAKELDLQQQQKAVMWKSFEYVRDYVCKLQEWKQGNESRIQQIQQKMQSLLQQKLLLERTIQHFEDQIGSLSVQIDRHVYEQNESLSKAYQEMNKLQNRLSSENQSKNLENLQLVKQNEALKEKMKQLGKQLAKGKEELSKVKAMVIELKSQFAVLMGEFRRFGQIAPVQKIAMDCLSMRKSQPLHENKEDVDSSKLQSSQSWNQVRQQVKNEAANQENQFRVQSTKTQQKLKGQENSQKPHQSQGQNDKGQAHS